MKKRSGGPARRIPRITMKTDMDGKPLKASRLQPRRITVDTITDEEILSLRVEAGNTKIEGGTISDLCIVAMSSSHAGLRRRSRERCAEILSNGWRCHARPAGRGGATCGNFNVVGITHSGPYGRIPCCEKCGCTKKASDDRHAKLEARA